MSDVFISYHEKSAGELAEQIADALDDAGISAWCARRDMALGGNFAREIPNQIHACRLFLLILNDNVYHSEHIENEVGIAFSRLNKGENIRIFPLNVGECPLKGWLEYYLIHPQGVKFPAQPDEKRLQRLVKQIAKALNQEMQPAPKSAPPKVQAQPAPIPQATPEPPPGKIIKRGECGDNVTYTLDEYGVLTISGTGAMWNFAWNKEANEPYTPWLGVRDNISRLEIQSGVTTIGVYAFCGCSRLTSVNIPNSVTTIEGSAFGGCSELRRVTIPNGVKCIKLGAFVGCKGLISVKILNGVTTIEGLAFKGCSGLTSVVIPDSVTTIEGCAFGACKALTSVLIPDSVTTIESGAFVGCTGLISVKIPDSVTKIKRYAFAGCAALANVNIPDSVTIIEEDAFKECTGLFNVSVPAHTKIFSGIFKKSFPANVRVTRRK